MSPSVYFDFEQIINAYYNTKFDNTKFDFITYDGQQWTHLSLVEAIKQTFCIVEKNSQMYLYTDELNDIIKGKKIKRFENSYENNENDWS